MQNYSNKRVQGNQIDWFLFVYGYTFPVYYQFFVEEYGFEICIECNSNTRPNIERLHFFMVIINQCQTRANENFF